MSRPRFVAVVTSMISLGCSDPLASQEDDEQGESSSETGEDESSTSQSLDGESDESESESSESESESESSESESDESESSEGESTEGETGEPTGDCPSSTNIEGEPAALPNSPDCELVCAPGWSNPTAPLAVEWVLDLEPVDLGSSGEALLPGPDDSVLVVVEHHIPAPVRMHSISSTGELEWTVDIPGIAETLEGAISDSTGSIYVGHIGANPQSWTPEGYFSAISPLGEKSWTAHSAYGMIVAIAPRDEGLVALMSGPGFLSFDRFLVAVSSAGEFEWSVQTADEALQVAVAPNGDIVVAGGTAYEHYTGAGELVATSAQAFQTNWLTEAGFVDDDTFVQTGSLLGDSNSDGLIAWQPLGGPGWFERYQMGDAICDGQVSTGEEQVIAFAALADGGLIVVGDQSFQGYPEPWGEFRPWVGHIDAGGDLVAADLGIWTGRADDVIAGPDGSALVLINHQLEDFAFQVRKYALQ